MVIGAGAAGIAAARRIQAANRKVIVIEAANQIGGRCLTDTSTFDVPFDRGARWMHNPDTNPMIRLARSRRARNHDGAVGPEDPDRPPQRPRRRNRRVSRRAGARQPRHRRRLAQGRHVLRGGLAEGSGRLGGHGGIRARRQLCRQGSERRLGHRQGPRARIATPRSAAVRDLGTLIAKLGEQVPLALSTPATRISWSGRDVTVETPAGRIVARAAIITVSSNVLAAGDIKFDA